MGVDDVEPIVAMTAPQRPRAIDVGARPARCEREHLNFHNAGPPQRRHLVGDEAAERRLLGTRVHVGDDQRAHP